VHAITTLRKASQPPIYALDRLLLPSTIAACLAMTADLAGTITSSYDPVLRTILIMTGLTLSIFATAYDTTNTGSITAPTLLALIINTITTTLTILIPAIHGFA
jgi:hypothetical protein